MRQWVNEVMLHWALRLRSGTEISIAELLYDNGPFGSAQGPGLTAQMLAVTERSRSESGNN